MERTYVYRKIIVALIVALASVPAAAARFHDGAKLKAWAEAYDRSLAGDKPKPSDTQEVLTFMGYVAGVSDALSGMILCTPPGVRIHQIVVIVKQYIHKHPEMLQRPASHSVIEALSQAYPCKPQK
jgi:hypothetical protein